VRPARRLLLLAPTAVVLAAVLLPPAWRSPIPLCALNALTGLECPGCGMTRAFLLVGHGRFREASATHPAALPAFLIMAGLAAAGIMRAARGR
jgi:hypothetical protein